MTLLLIIAARCLLTLIGLLLAWIAGEVFLEIDEERARTKPEPIPLAPVERRHGERRRSLSFTHWHQWIDAEIAERQAMTYPQHKVCVDLQRDLWITVDATNRADALQAAARDGWPCNDESLTVPVIPNVARGTRPQCRVS
jgi:hypothetical protein